MFGFIDINGNEIIAPEYDQAYSFLEGYACVKKGDKYYYINLKGEVIDPGPYTHCRPFSSGLAPVSNQFNKLGYIDKSFTLKIPCEYDKDSTIFQKNYAVVIREGVRHVINQEDQIVLSGISDLLRITEGLGMVLRNGRYGFIDITGQVVIPCEWELATLFNEGFATGMKDDLFSIIDRSGKEMVKPQYNYISPFNEGIAFFKKANKFGFINFNGEEIISPQFKEAKQFSNGLAPVRNKKRWGYIDVKGAVTIDFQFDEAHPFNNGYANVVYQDEWAIIDTQGKIYTYPKYSWIGNYSEGFIGVIK